MDFLLTGFFFGAGPVLVFFGAGSPSGNGPGRFLLCPSSSNRHFIFHLLQLKQEKPSPARSKHLMLLSEHILQGGIRTTPVLTGTILLLAGRFSSGIFFIHCVGAGGFSPIFCFPLSTWGGSASSSLESSYESLSSSIFWKEGPASVRPLNGAKRLTYCGEGDRRLGAGA